MMDHITQFVVSAALCTDEARLINEEMFLNISRFRRVIRIREAFIFIIFL